MSEGNHGNPVDRRIFLGGSAAAMLAVNGNMNGHALAQDAKEKGKAKMDALNGRRVSEVVTEYITSFDLAKVPQPVMDRARIAFIDTVGVMLAGSHEHVAHLMLAMVKAEASPPAATIVGQSVRASPQLAALANGVAGHAMDYDLTFISGQPIAALIPAILPLAETTGAGPAEVVAAFIIGAEVTARFVRANFLASSVIGWHPVGTVGVIGAAAAAARLLKVPAAAIPDVLGIAASSASGISVNFGTMSKPYHAGNAARNGVAAALLGMQGFTSSPIVFEAPAGYFATFGRGVEVTYEPFKDLGSRYDLVSSRLDIKAYPCGGLTHTSIAAALDLRERVGTRIGDIKGIHCFVTRNAGQRAGTQYPANVEAAKFSVAYLVPYSLIHGAPKIAAFTEKALEDERIKVLAKTVTASVDPELGPGTSGSPARVRITMADGQVLEQRVDSAIGTARTPMTQAQLEEKFFDCAAQAVSDGDAKKILAVLKALPGQGSLNELWPLLRKA